MAVSRAPAAFFGGKASLADLIVSLFPPHLQYCEVFGGMGSVLFTKPPSKLECWNDIDSGVVNFFRVLRDPDMSAELIHQLDLTPFSREEFDFCWRHWDETVDQVERARRWFTALTQSYSKTLDRYPSWSISLAAGRVASRSFRTNIEKLSWFTTRLRHVSIEHRSWDELLPLYDRVDTLFFVDPPYLHSTRKRGKNSRGYRHEMTQDDHQALLEMLLTLKGMVILCGYPSALYSEALAGWRCITKDVYCASAPAGAWRDAPTRSRRTECIWLSPNAVAHQPQLPFETAPAQEAAG